jgi:hypothetical protein
MYRDTYLSVRPALLETMDRDLSRSDHLMAPPRARAVLRVC